ncbi:MAG: Ig-like domain-containing protein [Gemmatimonadota bacterium]|nr:Ig-like domain-containing protein [Gemmatimonadota bacterium]
MFGLGPRPGDIYREYSLNLKKGDNWRVTDPQAGDKGAHKFLPNAVLTVNIDDLEGALRAEVIIDRWGGHAGTSEKRIRFNGNQWLDLPELTTMEPGEDPVCFMYQDNPIVEIPLGHLSQGQNTFEGTCGGQVCFDFNWGQWGWYGIIVRIYYNSSKAHPTGKIVSPVNGTDLRDNPAIRAEVSSNAGISQVDFLARCEGYDVDGDGIFRQWQRYYQSTNLKDHVGTAVQEPYEVCWDTRWLPDQVPGSVELMARVGDVDGIWFVTETVEGLSLVRDSVSVRLYKAVSVPPRFWVRDNRRASCIIPIPEAEPLEMATEAVIHFRTWNGINEKFTLNDRWSCLIGGANHRYKYSRQGVPLTELATGDNKVSFYSVTEHHGVEILWPGPAVTIRYTIVK